MIRTLLTLTLMLLGTVLGQSLLPATPDQLEIQDNLLMQLHAVASDAPQTTCAAGAGAMDVYLSPLPSGLVIQRLEDLRYQNKVISLVQSEARHAGTLGFSVAMLDHGVLIIHVSTDERYSTSLCIERNL
ncbi:hypothetical protein GCM10022631_27460 [Deinococcus rubellus]|uniref:hypothetical protein n=1 Tax=Deinococcus rubellus TaxID=1889240 RepID=UPI0031EF6586